MDAVQHRLAEAYPTTPVLISEATVAKGLNAYSLTTESRTDHSMLHILDCSTLVSANDGEGKRKRERSWRGKVKGNDDEDGLRRNDP